MDKNHTRFNYVSQVKVQTEARLSRFTMMKFTVSEVAESA